MLGRGCAAGRDVLELLHGQARAAAAHRGIFCTVCVAPSLGCRQQQAPGVPSPQSPYYVSPENDMSVIAQVTLVPLPAYHLL